MSWPSLQINGRGKYRRSRAVSAPMSGSALASAPRAACNPDRFACSELARPHHPQRPDQTHQKRELVRGAPPRWPGFAGLGLGAVALACMHPDRSPSPAGQHDVALASALRGDDLCLPQACEDDARTARIGIGEPVSRHRLANCRAPNCRRLQSAKPCPGHARPRAASAV
jgi:hypothetical protein